MCRSGELKHGGPRPVGPQAGRWKRITLQKYRFLEENAIRLNESNFETNKKSLFSENS